VGPYNSYNQYLYLYNNTLKLLLGFHHMCHGEIFYTHVDFIGYLNAKCNIMCQWHLIVSINPTFIILCVNVFNWTSLKFSKINGPFFFFFLEQHIMIFKRNHD
jgi:hypothetical protein